MHLKKYLSTTLRFSDFSSIGKDKERHPWWISCIGALHLSNPTHFSAQTFTKLLRIDLLIILYTFTLFFFFPLSR